MSNYDHIDNMLHNTKWTSTLYNVNKQIDNAIDNAIINNNTSELKFLSSTNFYGFCDKTVIYAIDNDRPEIIKFFLEMRDKNISPFVLLDYAMNNHNNSAVNIIVNYVADIKNVFAYNYLISCAVENNYSCVVKKIFSYTDVLYFINYETFIPHYTNYFANYLKQARECGNIYIINILREVLIKAFPIKLPDDIIVDIIVKYV